MRRTVSFLGVLVMTAAGASAQDSVMRQTRIEGSADRQSVEAKMVQAARVPVEANVVKGAPYSAEVVTESVQLLADGNRIVRKTSGRVYRDGQGRTRREQDVQPGRVGSISIVDPVARVSYSLDADKKIAWKSGPIIGGVIGGMKVAPPLPPPPPPPVDPAALERRKQIENEIVAGRAGGARARGSVSPAEAPPPPPPPPLPAGVMIGQAYKWDEKTEKLPARNIEGVMAEGTRTTRTIPAGDIGNEQPIVSITEQWRSPELNVLVLTRTSDPRTGESTYKLLNITRAEPAASWFEVPADYTVRETGIKRTPSAK